MRHQISKLAFFVLVTAVALSGCGYPGSEGPDLVPANAPGNPTFCERDEAGDLRIYVKNQGDADAPSSEVEVQFFNVQPGVSPKVRAQGGTGPLAAGETSTAVISVEIPEDCFNPDCDFEISVDIVNEVKETDEQNNSVQGACIG
jgi:hypothetical protein